jgi:hypothetical protein
MSTYHLRFVNRLLNYIVITGYVRNDANRNCVWLDQRKGKPSKKSVWVQSKEISFRQMEGNLITVFCHIRAHPDSGFVLDAFAWDDAWVIYLNERRQPQKRKSNQAMVAAIVTDIESWYRPMLWVRQHKDIEKEFPLDIDPSLKRRLKQISVGDLLFFQGKIVRTDDEYGQAFLVTKIADVVQSNVLGQIESVKSALLTDQ